MLLKIAYMTKVKKKYLNQEYTELKITICEVEMHLYMGLSNSMKHETKFWYKM